MDSCASSIELATRAQLELSTETSAVGYIATNATTNYVEDWANLMVALGAQSHSPIPTSAGSPSPL
jgi:hypothetical protein